MATPQVIVLNGGSSSGKSGISRCLQTVLSGPWLRLGVDDLVDRLPPGLLASGDGLAFGSHGQVATGTGFSEMEAAWLAGVAAMAKAGACIVYDDVFLSAPRRSSASQRSSSVSASCGSACAALRRRLQARRSHEATGRSGWRPHRPRWSTKRSSTTSRWTSRTLRPPTARASSRHASTPRICVVAADRSADVDGARGSRAGVAVQDDGGPWRYRRFVLIVISGLPGTGKSTVAAAVAARAGAVHFSVDDFEQALLASGVEQGWTTGVAAYEVVRVAAERTLALGHMVVVDAVNDSEPARDTWRRAASAAGSDLRFVVLTPPDALEHRRRLETRRRGLLHVSEPTWEQVEARAAAYAPWAEEPFAADAAQDLNAVVEQVVRVAGRHG